jgi:hypothetical protein
VPLIAVNGTLYFYETIRDIRHKIVKASCNVRGADGEINFYREKKKQRKKHKF